MSTGKWLQPGVPHKGWSWLDVHDLGEPAQTCEMCEVSEIRYVHTLSHPEYSGALEVGCICAEHMAEDYAGPREREATLRGLAGRRQRWQHRQWHRFGFGSQTRYVRTSGFQIEVYPDRDGWRVRITHRASRRSQLGRKTYGSEQAAMHAGLDALLWAEQHLS